MLISRLFDDYYSNGKSQRHFTDLLDRLQLSLCEFLRLNIFCRNFEHSRVFRDRHKAETTASIQRPEVKQFFTGTNLLCSLFTIFSLRLHFSVYTQPRDRSWIDKRVIINMYYGKRRPSIVPHRRASLYRDLIASLHFFPFFSKRLETRETRKRSEERGKKRKGDVNDRVGGRLYRDIFPL